MIPIVLASPANAAQGFLDGNRLYAMVAADREAFDAYTVAIADVLQAGDVVSGHRACMVAGITEQQIWDIVSDFLARHPELRHFSASSLAAGALAQAFPCQVK